MIFGRNRNSKILPHQSRCLRETHRDSFPRWGKHKTRASFLQKRYCYGISHHHRAFRRGEEPRGGCAGGSGILLRGQHARGADELCLDAHGRYDKVALVTDVRERDGFGELLGTLEELKAMDCTVRILYMDADLRTLVRRYKESRRPHPLAGPGITLEQAVAREEELLAPIKEKADYIINSSQLTLGQLQNRMFSIFAGTQKKRELQVTVMSFGYKHGIPLDADLVFDVRFLPNPFYVEALRPLSGLDRPVAEFVFGYPQTRKFMEMIAEMLDFLMPHYVEEGKVNLTIAIGCTGGRHRSVAIAAAIHEHLTAKGMSSINVNRDIEK